MHDSGPRPDPGEQPAKGKRPFDVVTGIAPVFFVVGVMQLLSTFSASIAGNLEEARSSSSAFLFFSAASVVLGVWGIFRTAKGQRSGLTLAVSGLSLSVPLAIFAFVINS